MEHFEESGEAVLASSCRMSLEGIVSKALDAPYTSGRGDAWTKAKCRGGQEVIICGWTHDNGRVRSLLVGVYRAGELTYVGRVGTGSAPPLKRRCAQSCAVENADQLLFEGSNAPRTTSSAKWGNVKWAKPKLVAEIEFAGWTGDGNCAPGRVQGTAGDKPASEVKVEVGSPAAADAPARAKKSSRGKRPRPCGRRWRASPAIRCAGEASSAPGVARR